ncbi:MAG: hypothetical protein N2C14_32200, partial [Planctomycetales bacterium]
WSFFGGMIARLSALQLAREERSSLKEALRHAWSKWRAYLAGPILPLIGALMLFLPMLGCGLLMQSSVGAGVAAFAWPLQLLAAALMALLLAGLMLGWPLMWATIAAEESDSFDALSRSYSYVYQRPFHYMFYVALAALIGMLTWKLVMLFASLVIYCATWSAAWGSSPERMQAILSQAPPEAREFAAVWGGTTRQSGLSPSDVFGATVISCCVSAVYMAALSYAYSYFWTASTAIYLLLRMDLEGTELEDVHVEPDDDVPEMPSISQDAEGLPTIDPPEEKPSPSDPEAE